MIQSADCPHICTLTCERYCMLVLSKIYFLFFSWLENIVLFKVKLILGLLLVRNFFLVLSKIDSRFILD